MPILGTVDWTAFTGAVTGVLPDAIALAAGVVATVVTAALIFKGVSFVQSKVRSAIR
jgi:hypothetical protein